MELLESNDFFKGWFIGDFHPTTLPTHEFEAAFKSYQRGENEPKHVHKISTEYTLVTHGRIRMNGHVLTTGQFAIVRPGEPVEFEALEDSATVVIKVPCAPDDKYVIEE